MLENLGWQIFSLGSGLENAVIHSLKRKEPFKVCEEGWPQLGQERESRQDFSCPCVSPLCYQMGPNNLIQSEKIELGGQEVATKQRKVKSM